MVCYPLTDLEADMSFLEILDELNEQLITKGESPVEFDHNCREGICYQCCVMIYGIAHGPEKNTTTCQLHLRAFKSVEEISIENFRAKSFPLVKELKVYRSALDRIIASGGYISINKGQAP